MLIAVFCRKCKKEFEVIVKREDKNKKQNCPDCGTASQPDEIQKSGFILAGSGWYRDGYK